MPIASVEIAGNRATKTYVVRREIEVDVGDPFTIAGLHADLQRLGNLVFIGAVQFSVEERADSVALTYTIKEMPSYIPYIAFKYTEENGFSVGPALSAVNLFGRGIRVSGRLMFGGTTTFALMLRYPWIDKNHRSFDLDFNHQVRDDTLNEFEATSTEFLPWLGSFIKRNGRIKGTVGYFAMQSDVDGKTLEPDNSDQMITVGGAIGYDSRDSWRSPRDGWQNEVQAVYYGWNADFLQAILDLRRFQPMFSPNTQLMLGSLLSYQTGEIGVTTPEYMQYYMGGANSIRGYDINTLGPELHGLRQYIFMAEYQWDFLPLQAYNFYRWSANVGLQLALFVDSGIAWTENEDFNTTRWKSGYGLGFRVLVPGSEEVRFDVGWSREEGFHFHFANWFKWTAQRFRVR